MSKLLPIKKWLQEKEIDAFLISRPEHRFYLSGFTGSSGCLLITTTLEQDFFLTDSRYREQAEEQVRGYYLVPWQESLWSTLKELFQQNNLRKIGIDQDYMTLATYEKLKKTFPDITLLPLPDPCLKLRRFKDPPALQTLKKAIEISDKAFAHILEFIKPGLTEKEIALELEFFMGRLGSNKPAFETIIASGIRAALPHGIASERIVQKGEIILIDCGAVYQGYHSDLSRTIVLGKPNSLQQERYELVLNVQKKVMAEIQPGMRACDADALAREMITKAGYGPNFCHSLGHGVGLAIHEEPHLSPHDETILEPGMVVTIEPGIYFTDWGGIRIEDIVVLTNTGCEKLTKAPNIFYL